MSRDSQNLEALNAIRDRTHLLVLANIYLCEEPFLRKIGLAIDSHVQKLKGDIYSLKKKFPGKFAEEVDTDDILSKIHRTAQQLQHPDQLLNDKCTTGELGRELEDIVNTLTGAVNKIKGQVEGKAPSYSKADSIINKLGWFQGAGSFISSSLGLVVKILIILIVLSLIPLGYLLFTMDKEEALLKEITQVEVYIQSQEQILSEKDYEKAQILQKIKAIENREVTRDDRLAIMDLEVAIHKLDEERQKVEVEISLKEDTINRKKKKIEEIETKPFIKRLLRL